jgi:hypothetical protein
MKLLTRLFFTRTTLQSTENMAYTAPQTARLIVASY